MMLSSQGLGPRPVQPVTYPPNFGKDEVITWFRNAPSATRIDTMCGILESCGPFEIRYMGTILEIFARKDCNALWDPTEKANKVGKRGTGMTLDKNVELFFQIIKGKDDDIRRVSQTSNTPASSTMSSSVNPLVANTNPQTHLNSNLSVKSLASQKLQHQSLSSVIQETPQSHRPIAAQKTEPMRSQVYEPPQLRQQLSRNHSPAVAPAPAPIPQPIVNGIGDAKRSNCSSEDETESPTKDYRVVEFHSTRQKLIMYLSLLTSTNHDAALVYYTLMSQVSKTVGDGEWMEQQTEETLDEVKLLYTLGIHHPAFSYEQRLMLSEILVKVRRELQRKQSQAYAQHIFSPVQYPHGQMFFQMPPMTQTQLSLEHLGTPSSQLPNQGSSGGPQIPSSLTRPVPPLVDTSRLPPPPPTPQISYYQQLPFPPYQGIQGMGSSTHSQNLPYINAPPLVTNVGQLSSVIRSSSPNTIPSTVLVSDAGAVPISAKVEKVPPPLYENIPAPCLIEAVPLFPVSRPDKVSCFNCGEKGHIGADCNLPTVEEGMPHSKFHLNFKDNNNKNTNN